MDSSYAYSKDVAHLENAYLINIKSNPTGVKEQIMEHGAVGTMYSNYSNGMTFGDGYNAYFDTSNTITSYGDGSHAVMIVGWDDNFSKDKFLRGEKPSSNGAWLIRNSWGTDFDYFWMSYETKSLADTAWAMDFTTADNYDNNYQLDGGISISQNPTNSTVVANVYDVAHRNDAVSETLKAVSISSMHVAGVNYSIDIYTDLMDDKPSSGTLQAEAHTEGTTTYAGIYTIPLKNEVNLTPGSKFAVVVKTDKAAIDYEQAVKIATGSNLETVIWDCNVSRNNGKSFYGNNYGNFWSCPHGNYCIKAFTTNNVYTTYNITYKLDGGENNASNPTICGGNDAAITLQAPTKDGCKFDGWYLDSAYTTPITEIPAHASQEYTLYAKWSSALGDSVYGRTLNLDGNIAFNMYMDLPSDLAENKDVYMEFTFPDKSTSRMTVAEARRNGGHYIFSFKVAAKEMTVDVKARMHAGNTYGKEYTVSVQKYAEYILTHPNDYSTLVVSLIKSMLNYGTAAQQLFDYQTDKPANEIMSENDRAVADHKNDFKNYEYSLSKSNIDSGIKWYGSSLILESDTCVRDYFQVDSSHINEYTFEGIIGNNNNSIKLTPVEKTINGTVYYYVEVPDIKAQNLDQSIKVVVKRKGQLSNDIELQYNAFSYAYVISQDTATYQKTIDVTNAMYEYWKNAKAYVDNNNQSNA